MMTLTLLTTTIAMLSSLPLISNPATASIWLVLSALSLALSIHSSTSSWFALALFLIYVGGMLVMFSYFVMIQPNQHLALLLPLTTAISLSLALFTLSVAPKTPLPTAPHLSPALLLYPNHMPLLLLLAISLFLALVAVVKITTPHKGPIRPFS